MVGKETDAQDQEHTTQVGIFPRKLVALPSLLREFKGREFAQVKGV